MLNTKFSTFTGLLVFAFLLATGCNKSNSPDCSSAANITNPACTNQIPPVTTRPATLNVTFADSVFYDQLSATWDTITKDRLTGGTTGITIPIYSNFLNETQAVALASSELANSQKAKPTATASSAYNFVPYIEIVPEDGVTYLYDYIKRDLNNNIIYEKNGTVPVTADGRVILPLINAEFNNNFYSTNTSQGARFQHSLTFAAQSTTQKGVLSATISFETTFQIPPTDFLVNYTGDMQKFSLDKRWQYYFNGTDYNANKLFHFFQLKETNPIPEQIPLDVKIVFQSPPTIKMDEDEFFELPFDYDVFKSTNTISPLRGSRFYDHTTTLSSDTDFQMNLQMNNTTIPLTNVKELEYLAYPAATPWTVDFFFNMNQNAGYAANPTSGVGLLSPLKPICWEFNNSTYNPISEESAKASAIAANGYISICHPDSDKKVVVAAGTTSTVNLTDSWYNYFSYIPYNQYKKELGHFYGLKKVRFYASGCFRLYTRQVGTTSYVLTSKGNAQCGASTDGTDTGWVYYSAEQVFTVFDNVASYQNVNGLTPLLQTFSSSPTIKDYPIFKFNGLENDLQHVY